MSKQRCGFKVYDTWGASWLCSRTTKLVERNGKLYCWQHDPVRIAERRDQRNAAWDAKWAAERQVREDKAAAQSLLERKAAAWDKVAAAYQNQGVSVLSIPALVLDTIEALLQGFKESQP